MIGKILKNKYRIEILLGEGSSAFVFQGIDLSNNQTIAIKQLKKITHSREEQELLCKRFEREALIQRKLKHPHILEVYDFFEEEGSFYFTMEYIDGKTLKEFLSEKEVSLQQILNLFYQAMDGLQWAHSKEVIHRDIKPSNILLSKEGVVKIADFGIAKALDDPRLTQTGFLLGTPLYMSPEQCRGENHLSPSCDIYSLGITFFESLVGHPPFQMSHKGGSHYQLIQQHLFDLPPLLEQINPDIPTELNKIVQKSLQKMPQDRYHSIEEMKQDLMALEPFLSNLAFSTPEKTSIPNNNPLETKTAATQPSIPFSSEQWDLQNTQKPSQITKEFSVVDKKKSKNPLTTQLAYIDISPKSTTKQKKLLVGMLILLPLFGAIIYFQNEIQTLFSSIAFTHKKSPKNQPKNQPNLSKEKNKKEPIQRSKSLPKKQPNLSKEKNKMEKEESHMVLISGGWTFLGNGFPYQSIFSLLSRKKRNDNPYRKIFISSFHIDTKEITVGEYATCVLKKKCNPILVDPFFLTKKHGKKIPLSQILPHNIPMPMVNWENASLYCRQQKKRLPTEWEWELAARGPYNNEYSWGNEKVSCRLGNLKQCNSSLAGILIAITPKAKGYYGTLDMTGSLWEWTADCYHPLAYRKTKAKNPQFQRKNCKKKVLRGGSFLLFHTSEGLKTYYRYPLSKGLERKDVGFRCVKEEKEDFSDELK